MCPENNDTEDKDLEVTSEEEKDAEDTLVEEGSQKAQDVPEQEEEHEAEDLEKEVKDEEKELDEPTVEEKETEKEEQAKEENGVETSEKSEEDIGEISESDIKMKKSKVDEEDLAEEPAPLENVIFTLRTTVGREATVVDLLNSKLKMRPSGVRTMLHPAELKGYVFIEGSEDGIRNAIKGVPHIRGLIDRPVKLEDLKNFFAEDLPQINIKEGEIVEVIGGPFKREKAKIVRIDETKREAKIELIESAVPIPITISLDLLKATREKN